MVPGRRYCGAEIGEDAIRLLDAIDAPTAVIVGHDWGAGIVYRAAAIAPGRVTALCAVAIPHLRLIKPSPAVVWHARHFLTLRLPTGAWLARRANFAYVDALIRRWAPNWSGPDRDSTAQDAKQAFADPRVLDGALAYYKDSSPGGGTRLSQPALIVGGTTDIISAELFTRSVEEFDGPCEVLIADGAGHWPHREAAETFEQRLISWLQGVAPT